MLLRVIREIQPASRRSPLSFENDVARKSIPPTASCDHLNRRTEEHMYSVMIITRSGHSGLEHAVLVEQGINCWSIDPQKEVSLATFGGPALSRDGCVLSFMEGLVAANHTVIVRERRKDKHWTDYAFRRMNYAANYHYFLFGLAWGKAQWWQLRTQLERTIVPAQHLAVLTATGQYYYTHRWEPLTLRMPIV